MNIAEAKKRIGVLPIFHHAWTKERDLSPEDLEALKAQGLSDAEIETLWDEYSRSLSTRAEKNGGYTQLPKLRPDEQKDLLGSGLPGFVEYYIGLVSLPEEERIRTEEELLQSFLETGELYLSNTPQETRQLLRWMQDHPGETADYLEEAWSFGEIHTESFRELAQEGRLVKLNIPPETKPTP